MSEEKLLFTLETFVVAFRWRLTPRTVFKMEREVDEPLNWVPEEPFFFNPMSPTRLLSTVSVSARSQRNEIVKLGNLLCRDRWRSVEVLKEMMGLRSSRLTQKLMEEIFNALPSSYRKYIRERTFV